MKYNQFKELFHFRKDVPIVLKLLERRRNRDAVFFALFYCLVVVSIFYFLKKVLFTIGSIKMLGGALWFVELFTRTVPFAWAGVLIGLTPYLLIGIWCYDNRFVKVFQGAFFKKLVCSVFACQFALFIIDVLTSNEVGRFASRLFSCCIPFIMYMAYSFRGIFSIKLPPKCKGETFNQWRDRVGMDLWFDGWEICVVGICGFAAEVAVAFGFLNLI